MKEPAFLSDLLACGLDVVGSVGPEALQELRAMAVRQQQQLETQQQLLVARQQRLRFLQSHDVAHHQVANEAEKLRRLRERVEAQEAKLARLRALRGQVDQQKHSNSNLTSDLESIRALFNEKEKELAMAVTRVEQLTNQLEEIRRARATPHTVSPAALELERLRREITFRQRLNEQQNQRVVAQRAAIGQRQEEIGRIDQRIAELQARLHRKRLHNQQLVQQISAATAAKQAMLAPSGPSGRQQRPLPMNVAAVEPFTRTPLAKEVSAQTQDDLHTKLGGSVLNVLGLPQFAPNKNDPKYQTLPYNTKFAKSVTENRASRGEEEENNVPLTDTDVKGADANKKGAKISQGWRNSNSGESMEEMPSKDGEHGLPSHQDVNAFTPRPFGSSYSNVMDSAAAPVHAGGSPVKNAFHKPISSVAPTTSLQLQKNSAVYQTSSIRVTPLQPHVLSSVQQGAPENKDLLGTPQRKKPAVPPKPTVPIKPTPPPRQTAPFFAPDNERDSADGSAAVPAARHSLSFGNVQTQHYNKQDEDEFHSKQFGHLAKANVASVPPSRRELSTGDGMESTGTATRKGEEEMDCAALPAWSMHNTVAARIGEVLERMSVDDENKNTSQGMQLGPEGASTNAEQSKSDPSEPHQHLNLVQRVKKGNLKTKESVRQLRRVSFDPLALLLDAALEGELELVTKTATEVPNPSAANDEGITALHNAICAGHFDIVRFLVEYGCDVNAQDSDGWTPLHCAASCNNLPMVKFLVEHGACIFATTLSDHETAAEKCEEDEEGFDGCSEYLYSIQEKLGIMNNGAVYAVYDYEIQNSDELGFKEGDKLMVLHKGDEFEREWWWSSLDEKEGYIPRNLLGLYPRVHERKDDN